MNVQQRPESSKPSFELRISSFHLALALLLFMGTTAYARERSKEPPFRYAAGTENLVEGCKGTLELAADALSFRCSEGSISTAYASISLMQFRPDVSPKVRKMKLGWKVKPPSGIGKRKHYFTVLYTEKGVTHAMVLEVSPQVMRPYLAELDLKTGKRVEVKGYEEYE